jgi:hypothetical protein
MTILAAEVTALFDPIMASIKTKLDVLSTENHLKGAAYDEVYSQALSATLQQVVQLIIGTDQRELTAAKVLTEEQSRINLVAEYSGILANTAKTDAERVKTEAETLLVPKQGALLDQQLLNAVAEKLNIQAKTTTLNAELLNIPKQGALLDQQVLVEAKQVEKLDADIANIHKQWEVIAQEILKAQAEVNTLNAELLNIPKKGTLLDSQVIGSNFENELKHQQSLNLAAEGDLIPLQGNLLIAQNEKLSGEIWKIPKEGALIDAQIVELINRGKNLDLEAKKLEQEGKNLVLEAAKLKLDADMLTEEIILKKAEAKNEDAKRIEILTSAEVNRSNAIQNTWQTNNIRVSPLLEELHTMGGIYNTYVAHTAGAEPAFDKYALQSKNNNIAQFMNNPLTTQLFV